MIKKLTILNPGEVEFLFRDGAREVVEFRDLTERDDQDRLAALMVARGYPSKEEVMDRLENADAAGVTGQPFDWP